MKYSNRVAALEKQYKPALKPVEIQIHFVGDDPEEMYEIWDEMQIPRGSESWDWRVQTYIRDKGLST